MKPRTILLLGLVLGLLVVVPVLWLIRPRDPAGTTPGEVGLKIDLNEARAVDLAALPEVGPRLSERIVQYRADHGPFLHTDDLIHVPGIGPKILEQVRPYVTCGPATQPATQ